MIHLGLIQWLIEVSCPSPQPSALSPQPPTKANLALQQLKSVDELSEYTIEVILPSLSSLRISHAVVVCGGLVDELVIAHIGEATMQA